MTNRETMKKDFDYASFYASHYGKTLGYARRYIHNEDDACDVVSEAFLQLLELGDRLDAERNVYALLLSMVHNKCLDYLRRLQCYRGYGNWAKQTADRFSDDEFAALCQRELFRIIGQVLADMPVTEREVFREVRMEGRSYEEVSRRKGINVRCVEYQLKKATVKVNDTVRRMYG